MITTFPRFSRATVLLGSLACAALAPVVQAGTIVLNADSGTFMVDGLGATQINGVSVIDGGASGGIRTYLVLGDLDLLSTDTLSATGSLGVQLLVGNNANIAPGATVEITPGNSGAGAGGYGGTGGSGGLGGAAGVAARTTVAMVAMPVVRQASAAALRPRVARAGMTASSSTTVYPATTGDIEMQAQMAWPARQALAGRGVVPRCSAVAAVVQEEAAELAAMAPLALAGGVVPAVAVPDKPSAAGPLAMARTGPTVTPAGTATAAPAADLGWAVRMRAAHRSI